MWMTTDALADLHAECAQLDVLGAGRSQKQSARLLELRRLISAARTDQRPDDDVVESGMHVTVRFADGSTEGFLLSSRAHPGVMVVSPDAPISRAIDGRRVGETVSYQNVAGAMISITILATSPHDALAAPQP